MSTPNEVLAAIQAYEPDLNEFAYRLEDTSIEIPGLGTVTYVDGQQPGYEVSSIWIVFQVGDKYYQLDGYNDSYDAPEWNDSLTEVTKEEKITYVFTPVAQPRSETDSVPTTAGNDSWGW
jgi:hypothetical protein